MVTLPLNFCGCAVYLTSTKCCSISKCQKHWLNIMPSQDGFIVYLWNGKGYKAIVHSHTDYSKIDNSLVITIIKYVLKNFKNDGNN